MGDILQALQFAIDIANDDRHGYNQANRTGSPDFDCSSFISTCLYKAGFEISPNSWTGNMYEQLIKCGFKPCSAPWLPGDIHLTPGKHVVMSVSGDEIVHASIDERGKTTGGKPGDQTGKEICVRSYYNKPWTYHLRVAVSSAADNANSNIENVARGVINGKYGNQPIRQQKLEALGYDYATVQAKVNELAGKKDTSGNSIELGEIARQVIRGVWGNGNARKTKLIKAGYDFEAVQKLVNAMRKG